MIKTSNAMHMRHSNIKEGHIFHLVQADHCRAPAKGVRHSGPVNNPGYQAQPNQARALKAQPNQPNPLQDQSAVGPINHNSSLKQIYFFIMFFFFFFMVPAMLATVLVAVWPFSTGKDPDPAITAMTGNLESAFG